MQPRKLNVGISRFCYGGNGGVATESPDICNWFAKTVVSAKADPRVGDVLFDVLSDTPITLSRNAAVEWAKKAGVDVLIMVDSDQSPDMYLGVTSTAKPFFQSSFDFLYQHYDRGPLTIFAPYCGPPQHPVKGGIENPYVFRWEKRHTGHIESDWSVEQFTRSEAAIRTGIEEVAAGPTGLCMIDMRCFTEVLTVPYFEYEWEGDGKACPHCHQRTPGPRARKASTEDVVFFRNLSLNCLEKYGYNGVFCNWDAWAGHWKPWCVGKPEEFKADQVHAQLRRVVLENRQTDERVGNFHRGRLPDKGRVVIPLEDFQTNGHAKIGMQNGEPIAFQCNQNGSPEDRKALGDLLYKHAMNALLRDRPLRIVELGSWVGDSANIMADSAEAHCDYEIHCIDHWKGSSKHQRDAAAVADPFEKFKANCGERFDRTIFAHKNSTSDAAQWWAMRQPEDRWIDVLFIDAGHEYEDVRDDLRNWAPFVRPGGLIMGHDYHHGFPGVKRAVHEAFGYTVAVTATVWHVDVAVDSAIGDRGADQVCDRDGPESDSGTQAAVEYSDGGAADLVCHQAGGVR